MRLPSFRVRTLMAAVGLVALLTWGAMMGSRSYDDYRRAREYGWQAYLWRDRAVTGRWDPKIVGECAEYLEQLERKYRRAMWRPWQPVAPDPHAPGYDQWVEQERRAKEVAADPAAPGIDRPRDHRRAGD